MKKAISILLIISFLMCVAYGCAEPVSEQESKISQSQIKREPESIFSAILQKEKNKDFVILNMGDPQFIPEQWNESSSTYKSLKYTMDALVKKLQPNLITVTGDIMQMPQSDDEIKHFASFLESYGIPWAPVWGNHDYSCGEAGGIARLKANAEVLKNYENCLFESGPIAEGSGNYIIGIEEEGRLVEAIFMMDCLDLGMCGTLGSDVTIEMLYNSETLPHLEWYKSSVKILKEMGCNDSVLMTHVPLRCYGYAIYAAYKDLDCSLVQSYSDAPWNEGYEDSFGVFQEGPTGISFDDKFLEAINEMGNHTKHVLVAHNHTNNCSIKYKGVRLTYTLKTGSGNYYDNDIRGCTVIKVGSQGVSDLYHEYHHW